MRIGKKGEGGFAESMVALMAVIVTLMMFMAILPSAFMDDDDDDISVPGPMSVIDGTLVMNNAEAAVEENGWIAMSVTVTVIGTDMTFTATFGEPPSYDPRILSGTAILGMDDGRRMNSEYRMAVWS